ncbi:MAG: alpha/beta fold hydrolase [Pseudomonadota bacterium]
MRVDVKGHATFVATAGPRPEDAAAVVFLVHGAGMAASIWAAQLQALATGDRAVLAPTLPGHGAPGTSQASDGPLATSIEAAADALVDLFDAFGVARAFVVGHSMGSLVALETARRHPERVRGLGLVGSGPKMPVHPALLDAARTVPSEAAEQILQWGFGRPQGERPPALSLTGVGRRLLLASVPGVLATDLAACDAWQAGDLSGIGCPALVVIGKADRMTPPKAGRALAAALPAAETVELEGAGHMMMVERPRAVVLALRDWLNRASAWESADGSPSSRPGP